MFCFDVETLGKESNSVVLSLACVYFKPEDKPSYTDLMKDAFFVKFDVDEQVKKYGRKLDKGTIEWWAKQCDLAKRKSLMPNPILDKPLIEGFEEFRAWTKTKQDDDCWIWARGNLDQIALESISNQIEREPIWNFNRWRDVRTLIDILYDTKTGYVDVPGFDPQSHVIKHDPVHDIAYDVTMMLFGQSKNNA